MRSVPALALALTCEIAAAEPPLELHDKPLLLRDPIDPYLTVPTIPQPKVVGLGVTDDTHSGTLRLTDRATITGTLSSYLAHADAVPRDGNDDSVVARGWRASVRFSYDLGWAQLDAELAENALDSHYGSGRYRDVWVRISKSKRFSRWVTGWIGLSLARRVWLEEPPDGEANDTTITLSIGGTFR